jgi:hypothetical protein
MPTRAEAEALALRRLAARELAAVPRGVEDVHAAVAGRVFGALGPGAAPVRVMHGTIARGVYAGVSGGLWAAASVAGSAAARRAGPVALSDTPRGAAAVAALNGLFGDALAAEGSPLATPMTVRRIGRAPSDPARPLPAASPDPARPRSALAGASTHAVVFLHGLGETEHAWGAPGYGDRLADDLGVTPVLVRFNSGRHVFENGASLAALLDAFVADWPVPLERISLVGHSMGGLVARSAAHHGGAWTRHLRHIVSLGTPHAGAPLEQAVHLLGAALHLTPETRPFARLLRRRSAGIRDLRRGSLVDEDWRGQDPDALRGKARTEVPLRAGVTHCFVAATVTRSDRHPLGRLLGDTLVLSPSAAGVRAGFAEEHGLRLGGVHHLALLRHPAVYEHLRTWLA